MHRFGPEGRLELAEQAGTAFDPESVTESEALRLTVGPCHLDRDGRRAGVVGEHPLEPGDRLRRELPWGEADDQRLPLRLQLQMMPLPRC